MNAYTNPNFKTNKFDEFSDEEKRKYATYLFDCHECGQRTCVDAGGGALNPCLKKDRADHLCGNDGHDLVFTVVIGGHAGTPRSMASIEGRKPGEPSKRKAAKAA
jgi:hypothetical protein